MPKNQNISKKPSAKSKKKKIEDDSELDFHWIKADSLRFIPGLILFFLAVYMIIAFCSYLFSGKADFDLLENPTQEDIINESHVFTNTCGSFGAMMAYFFLHKCFGLASFIIPVYLVMVGMKVMRVYNARLIRWFVLLAVAMLWASVTLSATTNLIPVFQESFINPGGNHGLFVSKWLSQLIGQPGLFAVILLVAIIYLVYLSHKTVEMIRSMLHPDWSKLKRKKNEEEGEEDTLEGADSNANADDNEAGKTEYTDDKPQVLIFDSNGNIISDSTAPQPDDEAAEEDVDNVEDAGEGEDDEPEASEGDDDNSGEGEDAGKNKKKAGKKEGEDNEVEFEIEKAAETELGTGKIDHGDINTPYDPKLDLQYYKYPSLDLLDERSDSLPVLDQDEQIANNNRIIEVLRTFGVEISSIRATVGPTITLFEITPAPGVRISKIRNLSDDIALSLSAEGIRIIAPMPGKGTIGIEVPNKKKCIVSMRSVLASKAFQESKMELPCAIGKTITNEVYMVDLAKAPHLLVAGATGMGKSVGLNAIVTSLLYKKHPSELKIVMVDPKKVEFSIYSPIEKQFMAKLEEENDAVITDVQKVVKTLKSLCQLMDTRYDLLKKAHVRNIKEYNELFKKRQLNPENGHEFMPYIVVIIDEFGDLIMTAGKEIEMPICRIAQLARAVGIHMIIATQRPTTQIITGTIKANFPARMAFKVAAMMDSRIILDRPGANQLIGRGDMLYLQGSEPERVQCAFVDTPEVNRICNYIANQQSYSHPLFLPDVVDESGDGGSAGDRGEGIGQLDSMFDEVAKMVVLNQQGSTSFIQRKLSIGYNRAGRLMDQLEKAGIVGAQVGSKPREVLVQDPITLDAILESLHH